VIIAENTLLSHAGILPIYPIKLRILATKNKTNSEEHKLCILSSLIALILQLIQRIAFEILAILGWLAKQVVGEFNWQSPKYPSYSGKKKNLPAFWPSKTLNKAKLPVC